jgi:hypothetical protein
MSENIKRGYPNPNYTDEDVDELIEEPTVTLPASMFFELASKSTALDILRADIKANIDSNKDFSQVNPSLVLAVTGMNTYKVQKGDTKDE